MGSLNLVSQSAPVDPTTWLDVFAAVSPLLAALIAVSGVVWTVVSNNRRERNRQEQERLLARDRQEHERLLKGAELGAARDAKLRDDRIRVYSTMAQVTKRVDKNAEPVPILADALSELEMLTDDRELMKAADTLTQAYIDVWWVVRSASDREVEEPYKVASYEKKRELMEARRGTFLQLSRREIRQGSEGIEGLSKVHPTRGEVLPEPETSTSGP